MKTIKQLLRQPLKTAIGIVIVALAFAILVTCVGQYTATDLTRENLDDQYTTIGLVSDSYFWSKNEDGGMTKTMNLPDAIQKWIDKAVANNPDLIKAESSTGLVSAYSPTLSIDNFVRYANGYAMGQFNKAYPYRCAMLTVTLTKIGTIGTEKTIRIRYAGEEKRLLENTTYLCVGTIESAVGLGKDFVSPVGKSIVLHITVYGKEDFDKLGLQVGQTYLVYGENYADGNEQINKTYIYNHRDAYEELFGKVYYRNGLPNYAPMLEQYDCTMTLCDYSSLPWNFTTDSGITTLWDERPYYICYGDAVRFRSAPADEYIADYQLPIITTLNGSVEDFLVSDEGALWKKKLDEMAINNHSFPVLCVDKLGYQAAFSREQARIVDGRDFTENELAGGEKVCIISQSVAARSGVQVGDTIELKTYAYDPNIVIQRNEICDGTAYPSAAIYSEALGFTSEMETYTIVGLYRQEDAWENNYDPYGFTPNTVFVPKSSVTAEMITKDSGIYSTLVLQNGKLEEFKALMEEAGYPDLFICYDQGYSEFVASLDAYEEVSQKAFYIGFAAFVVIVLLFLFLYPAQQKRALMLMGTLGASAWGRFSHTFISILCVLVPGAALGGYVGSKLWTRIAAALMEWINIEIALESDMTAIAPKLTAASLATVAFAALIVSAALCRNRGLMKRK